MSRRSRTALQIAALGVFACLSAVVWAQEAAPGDPRALSTASVERVKDLLSKRDLAGALGEARKATELDPTYAAAWWARARCHELRANDVEDDKEMALEFYSRSLRLADSEEGRQRVRKLVTEGRFVHWVTEPTLPYLPGDYHTFTIPVRDPRLPKEEWQDLVGACSTTHLYPEQIPKSHPRFGGRYAGVSYAFVRDADDEMGRLFLAVRAYYPTVPLSPYRKDYCAVAPSVAELTARLLAYDRKYLGDDAARRFQHPVSVYLAEGKPAAPEIPSPPEVTLWQVETPRDGLDWIREVCRGLGRTGMPPVGAFPAPEVWAGGSVGELLYLKWLCLNSVDGRPAWGEESVDLTKVLDSDGTAALQAFLSAPPNDEAMGAPGADSIRKTAGLALYADSVLSLAERAGIIRIRDVIDPPALLYRVNDALRDRKPPIIRVPGGLFLTDGSDVVEGFSLLKSDTAACQMLPRRPVRYKVFLSDGEWTVTMAAQAPTTAAKPTVFTLRADGGPRRPSPDGTASLGPGSRLATVRLPAVLAGWYIVTLTEDNDGGSVALQSLTFSRNP